MTLPNSSLHPPTTIFSQHVYSCGNIFSHSLLCECLHCHSLVHKSIESSLNLDVGSSFGSIASLESSLIHSMDHFKVFISTQRLSFVAHQDLGCGFKHCCSSSPQPKSLIQQSNNSCLGFLNIQVFHCGSLSSTHHLRLPSIQPLEFALQVTSYLKFSFKLLIFAFLKVV